MSSGPITIYKRVRAAEAYPYDGTNAQAIVDWSAGHAYIAEGQLYIITDHGDWPADIGDTIIRGLVGEYYPIGHDAFVAGWRTP